MTEPDKNISNGVTIIKLAGKPDTAYLDKFEKIILSGIGADENKIIIDCSELSYLNSAGLRIFLLGAKMLKQKKGKLAVSGLSPFLCEIFSVSGIDKVIPVYTDAKEAINILEK